MKPSITFNIQDYPVEWVIFPTITMNMTDIEQGARILRCTQDEYETILWNYTALKNKFYPKSK